MISQSPAGGGLFSEKPRSQPGRVRVRGHRTTTTEEIPVQQRRCVLCGSTYNRCDCTCTWCGAKKWTRSATGWHHHVCGGKR